MFEWPRFLCNQSRWLVDDFFFVIWFGFVFGFCRAPCSSPEHNIFFFFVSRSLLARDCCILNCIQTTERNTPHKNPIFKCVEYWMAMFLCTSSRAHLHSNYGMPNILRRFIFGHYCLLKCWWKTVILVVLWQTLLFCSFFFVFYFVSFKCVFFLSKFILLWFLGDLMRALASTMDGFSKLIEPIFTVNTSLVWDISCLDVVFICMCGGFFCFLTKNHVKTKVIERGWNVKNLFFSTQKWFFPFRNVFFFENYSEKRASTL